MTARALVTGAYGFLGRHVARAAAAAGWEVHGLGHGAWARDEWRAWGIAEWHDGDVTLDTLEAHGRDPDLIVHCAGSGSVAFSMAHPRQDFARSVATTLDTLEYIRLHCPRATLVLPSSAGVYGQVDTLPIAVTGPLRPISPYGMHKKIGEDLTRSYAATFGINAAVVRLFSVYGPELRKQLLWDACRRLSQGEVSFGGTGDEQRDWIHVEDAAALILGAATAASSVCPVANGASGVGVPTRHIVEALARLLGTGLQPQFSGEVRAGDPPHYIADVAEARDWGWRPRRTLDDGLAEYVAWFRDQAV